jgi:hypothetical protein
MLIFEAAHLTEIAMPVFQTALQQPAPHLAAAPGQALLALQQRTHSRDKDCSRSKTSAQTVDAFDRSAV